MIAKINHMLKCMTSAWKSYVHNLSYVLHVGGSMFLLVVVLLIGGGQLLIHDHNQVTHVATTCTFESMVPDGNRTLTTLRCGHTQVITSDNAFAGWVFSRQHETMSCDLAGLRVLRCRT